MGAAAGFFPGRVRPGEEREWSSHEGERGGMLDPRNTFRVRALPLLKGFARPPFKWLANTGKEVTARLLAQTPDASVSPLICSTPFFADVAERWPGPVIYWLTDLIAEYSSADRDDVHDLDRRMCAKAELVCPNSTRLRDYLIETGGCDPRKITVVPNATRAANVLPKPPEHAGDLPSSLQSLQRPVAGIIGNLAGNMDWLLLQKLVAGTPWLTWVFVGSVSMHIVDKAARTARKTVIEMGNTVFVGRQPYGALAAFARAFDVAILPYLRCEPTYSGSSTRFYEHLVACRPMLSTRGLEELNRKEPLLTLFDTAEQGLHELARLRSLHFDDGLSQLRWENSQSATWTQRAQTIESALRDRLGTCAPVDLDAVTTR